LHFYSKNLDNYYVLISGVKVGIKFQQKKQADFNNSLLCLKQEDCIYSHKNQRIKI